MGLSERTPAAAPAATGLLAPRTGWPVGSDDPFYVGLNSLCSRLRVFQNLPAGSISGTPEKVPATAKYFYETGWNRMAGPGIKRWAGFQVFDFAASPAVPC